MASLPPAGAPAAAQSRINFKDVVVLGAAIVTVACTVTSSLRSDGQREQRLLTAETKIEQLEQRDDRRQDLLNQIDVRTARIEATLQMMTKGSTR